MTLEKVEEHLMQAHCALAIAAAPLTDAITSRSNALRVIGTARCRIAGALDTLMAAERAANPPPAAKADPSVPPPPAPEFIRPYDPPPAPRVGTKKLR